MPIPLRALIIHSSEPDCLYLIGELKRGGFDTSFTRVETAEQLHEALREKWDVVLSEFLLPRFGALEAMRILNERGRDIACIVVSAEMSDRQIESALLAGACDYVARRDFIRLNAAVSRELRSASIRRERQHLEDQLRHAQKLEAVGRLAGGVAHDFNNLLTIISGYSELLLAGEDLTDAQRAALEEIRRASQRGGSVTHRLLAFSRRQPMVPRIVRVNELLVGLEKIVHRIIGEDIELVTVPGAPSDTVKCDPAHLEQVLMNLVVNARDAMPHGGKLVVEAAQEMLDEAGLPAGVGLKSGTYVVLSIADTGVGMDAKTLAHLFEPFYTTKAPGKGTGLGLATAYGIVRQSGGAITVSSELGRGTTFRIYLPFVVGTEPEQLPAPEPRPARGSETVLLVEDETRVRKLIRDILTARGYHVLEASRGEAALRIAKSYKDTIHLAILDVVMPEMSGPEVSDLLLKLRPLTRVLYISGYTDEAILQHGIPQSGSAFLQKPFVPDALATKVREVLDGGSRQSAATPA